MIEKYRPNCKSIEICSRYFGNTGAPRGRAVFNGATLRVGRED